jgi:hypothetical protein
MKTPDQVIADLQAECEYDPEGDSTIDSLIAYKDALEDLYASLLADTAEPTMKPVIVIVRHPDYSDDIILHYAEANVVYIDLGSSFDTTPDNEEQAREWARDTWSEVKDLPEDHTARASVLETITYTVERYFNEAELAEILK